MVLLKNGAFSDFIWIIPLFFTQEWQHCIDDNLDNTKIDKFDEIHECCHRVGDIVYVINSVVVLGANRVVVSELSPGIVIGDVSVVTCVVMLSVLSTG